MEKEKTKKVIIKFSKKIYQEEAIKKAINCYKQLARFNFEVRNNRYVVEARNIEEELKDVFIDEFANYVLYLIKQ